MEENNKPRSSKGLVIILIAVLIVLLGVIAFLFIRMKKAEENRIPQGSELELDKSQGEYVERETAPPDDSGVDPAVSVTLPGWTEITIPADTTKIDRGIDFYNPDRNKGYYYLTFELNLDEDGDGEYETNLYKSGLVEAGKHIQEIEISKPLPPGTYRAQVFLQPYRMDEDKTATNNGSVNIRLIAE